MKKLLSLLLLFCGTAHAASPTVNSSVDAADTTGGTSVTITRPATIADGDVTMCVLGIDDSGTATWPAGWTEIFEQTSVGTMSIAWESNDGTEDGTTFDVTLSADEKTVWRCYSVSGARNQAPDISTHTTGYSTAPDPASLAPAGGSADYLYLAIAQTTNGFNTVSGFPTSYTSTGYRSESTGGIETLAWGQRALTSSSSDDPSAFTTNDSEAWIAVTLAFQEDTGSGLNNCAAGSGLTVASPGSGTTAEYAPCTKNEVPDLADTVNVAMRDRYLGYYIAGCSSTASNPAWSGTLPPGITIDQSTSMLSGTPTVGVSSFAASITCTNDQGSETHNFNWAIGGGGTDLTGSALIADSTAATGGDGLTVGSAFDELNDLAGITTEDQIVCLMDGSDFADETFELDVNGWTFQTCYESGGGLYAWEEGPNPSGTTQAIVSTTGLDCTDFEGTVAVRADDVTINAITFTGASHSCTNATDQGVMVSWDWNGADNFTFTNNVVRAWPSQALARAAYKRHRVKGLVAARGQNYTITDNTFEYNYQALDIQYPQYGYVARNTFTGNVHNGITLQGNDGSRHDFYAVFEDNDCTGSFDSDCFQFEPSHASGTGLSENLGWVVIKGSEFYGDTGEDGIDLKGAVDVLIEASIIAGHPGNNDGPCDGSLQVSSSACDEVGDTEDDRFSAGGVTHGGGGSEVVSGNILVTRTVIYDNLAGLKTIGHGIRGSRITSLGNNKDYTGSNTIYDPSDEPILFGAGNFDSATTDAAFINSIVGYSNTQNLGWQDTNEVVVDGLVIMLDNSEAPAYAYGGIPFTETSTLATWVSAIQSDSGFTNTNGVSGSACATCKEATVGFTSDDPDMSGDYDTQAYDLTPGAAAIDYGVPDTYATANSSGVTASVRDACMFFPRMTYGTGTFSRSFTGHYVIFGSQPVVEVIGRDCDAGTLTLASARDVISGDEVWMSDSDGVKYNDVGAIETDAATNPFD